jgi:enterochelin esterase-like enzyme
MAAMKLMRKNKHPARKLTWSASRSQAAAWMVVLAALCRAQVVNPYPYREVDASASPRISKLRKDIESGKTSALEEFHAETRKNGTPLIEAVPGDDRYSLVTFLWFGSAGTRNVAIVNGINGAEPAKNQMIPVLDTDVWYRTYEIRNDARFTYALSPDDPLQSLLDPARGPAKFQGDPLNPHRFPGIYSSYVELPGAPQESWLVHVAGQAAGKVEERGFRDRKVWVYTPPGFSVTGERYPLLVMLDGPAYVSLVPLPVMLDNLIAAKSIPPIVAVFVGTTNRGAELQCSADFSNFVAKELIPWARQDFHAANDPARTIIGGSSLGGLAASYAALTHGDVIGNVLSLSGSYWWTPKDDAEPEWLTRQFVESPKLPLRFFVSVGSMEERASQLVTNRHFRDVLSAKGYAIRYHEFNGAHDYLNWRGSLVDLLLTPGLFTR